MTVVSKGRITSYNVCYTKLLRIIGPVMVGPSSSHTAGAVKIGKAARKLMGEKIINAQLLLSGSFYATGKGHGTPKAP